MIVLAYMVAVCTNECFAMDAIIDFVVDGTEVESEEQTVEVLMRLPQYSRRVNWTVLYHYVRSIRTHGSIRAQ